MAKPKKIVVTKKKSRHAKVKRVLTVAVKGLVSAGLLTAAAVPLVLNAAAKAEVRIGAKNESMGAEIASRQVQQARSKKAAEDAARSKKAAEDASIDVAMERARAVARRNDEMRAAAKAAKRNKERQIVLA